MDRLDEALLVCPTYNPGLLFNEWLASYDMQVGRPAKAVIIDSSSNDGALAKATASGFVVKTIPKESFNHGGTRQSAIAQNRGYEYAIFLTQDAILESPSSLQTILSYFDDKTVAAVCGRQLPRRMAGVIESHSRLYNYRGESSISSYGDGKGLKSIFLSNSFAAYRIDALNEVGGFPEDVIFGEDMYVAAKLLKAGYKIAYAADACVYHSHDYSILQDMKRYFDMGVLHAREPWIREEFGGAEKEGVNFVVSELRCLLKHAFWRIPEGVLRTVLRYSGFRLGLIERSLPLWLKKILVMNKSYFLR